MPIKQFFMAALIFGASNITMAQAHGGDLHPQAVQAESIIVSEQKNMLVVDIGLVVANPSSKAITITGAKASGVIKAHFLVQSGSGDQPLTSMTIAAGKSKALTPPRQKLRLTNVPKAAFNSATGILVKLLTTSGEPLQMLIRQR